MFSACQGWQDREPWVSGDQPHSDTQLTPTNPVRAFEFEVFAPGIKAHYFHTSTFI